MALMAAEKGLTTSPNNTHQQKQLLTRFIRQAGKRSDTPSLIVSIAADADYLWLCRSIVNPDAEPNPAFAEALNTVCRDNGLTPHRLEEMLTPAAEALGLIPAYTKPVDYYRVLGVGSQANLQEIKTAFRRKAGRVHPDAKANLTGSSRQFVELNDAYRTLRDPVLRHHYDTNRQHLSEWHERPTWPFPADERPTILSWYLGGLVFIFILLLLFLDRIV